MSDDKGLDRRLLGSEIVRPSVAEDVLDESMTSMDTVLIVSQILGVV